MKLVLLPGLDGTGRLFHPFVETLPPTLEPEIVSYPCDRPLSYDQLLETIRLPEGPHVLLGESFSGPPAIRLAALRPPGLRGLILVGTFVRPPMSPLLAKLVHPAVFAIRPPNFALRRFLGGGTEVGDAIASVRPEVLAHRVREVLSLDATGALRAVEVPILVLAGRRDRMVRPSPLRPDATYVVLDAPHLILQTRPREAVAAIQGWMSSYSK